MALPADANLVVVWGYWWDETTQAGVNGTVTFDPMPLMGSSTVTPNLRDAGAKGWIKTRKHAASVDPDTGYFAVVVVASDDPDLDAYAGRKVTFTSGAVSEPPFTVAIPYNTSSVTVDAAMAAATGLNEGDSVRGVALAELAP